MRAEQLAGHIHPEVLDIARQALRACQEIETGAGLTYDAAGEGPQAGQHADKATRDFFYLALARMLAQAYPSLPDRSLPAIETGMYFLYRFVMHLDRAVDHARPLLLVPGLSCFTLGLERLGDAGLDASAWRRLRVEVLAQVDRTLQTVALEQFDGAVPDWDYARYARIARQKCAVATLWPTALHLASGVDGSSIRAAQVTALDHVHVAMQWLDDLADLADDRARRQPSLLWTRLDRWARANGIDLAAMTDTRLKQLAYTSGLAQQSIGEAIDEFSQALAMIDGLGMPLLEATLHSMVRVQRETIAQIDRLIAEAKAKVG